SAPFPDELVAAPAGGAIAWVYNAQGARNLWIATPAEYQGRALTTYKEDDGQELGELAWTPDGRALVYVRGGPSNSRGEYPNPLSLPAGVEQALWIVAATGGPPRRPAGGHSPAVPPKRAAPPWSIRVAEVATGRGREVWKADVGRGSAFREIVAENQLLWGAGGRLVFPWEKDGWTHLYAVPLSGGAAALLTPGAFEVEHVTLAPDGREVVFSSNEDDIDRRHVWRVSVAGGKPQAV